MVLQAARQHQQQLTAGGAAVWHPDKSWRGVLTPSSQASQISLGQDLAAETQEQLQNASAGPAVQQQQQQQPQPLAQLAQQRQHNIEPEDYLQQPGSDYIHELLQQTQQQQQQQRHVIDQPVAAEQHGAGQLLSHGGMRDTGGGTKHQGNPLRRSIGGSKRHRVSGNYLLITMSVIMYHRSAFLFMLMCSSC